MAVRRVACELQSGVPRVSDLFLSQRARYLSSNQCLRNTVRATTGAAQTFRSAVQLDIATPCRSFSSTSFLRKKGGKAAREEKSAATKSPDTSSSSNTAAAEDPFDFSALETDIAAALERLRADLAKLRTGGRFNPETVEHLRVQPTKTSTQTVKLQDLAQVIPKGRTVQILVGESDHVKPIASAIQASTLSLTPQPDPTGTNPLLLVLNVPPPTADSRRAAVADASKAGEKAATSVRDARGKQQKKLRALQLSKSARPDDLKKAGGLMEKVVEKGTAELKKVVENAKKVLESG